MDAAEHRCLPLCGDESGKERAYKKEKRIVTLPYYIVYSTRLTPNTMATANGGFIVEAVPVHGVSKS